MMRGIVIFLVGLLAVVAFVGSVAGWSSDDGTQVPNPAPGRIYSDDVIGRASRMTQQMSVSGPLTGHEYHQHGGDEQLRLSQAEPEFGRELTAYQQQIDRMLARTP